MTAGRVGSLTWPNAHAQAGRSGSGDSLTLPGRPETFSAAARESLGNLWAAALVWPERCPGGACGCRPGQGGEDSVTLLAFRSRPREAGHIALI